MESPDGRFESCMGPSQGFLHFVYLDPSTRRARFDDN